MGPGSTGGESEADVRGSQELGTQQAGVQIVRSEEGRAKECRIRIDGVEYRFAPIGTMIRVLAQEEISRRRKTLWQEAIALVKEIKGEEAKELLVEAYRIQQRAVVSSIEECLAWLVSPEGDRFHFSQSLKKFQPSLTNEQITEIYDRATASQLNDFRDFQYIAYNPEAVESAALSAARVNDNLDLFPEEFLEDLEILIRYAQRMV